MVNATDNSFVNVELSTHVKSELDPANFLAVLSEMKHGLIINTGLTGTGKSYTQIQFLKHLNETQKLRIFTLEDPIEYIYVPDKATFNQYEVGQHVASFAKGANLLGNAHPDVLQISELRDSETIATAIEAAFEMLIVTSLHVSAAEDAIERIIDNLPVDEVEDLSDDLAVLPIIIVHHENRKIVKILKLDPRS